MRSEQVRARHILVKISPHATDDEKEIARKKASVMLERVKKGEDFAKLAEDLCQDPGYKAKGCALGYFSRGRMVKTFEDELFRSYQDRSVISSRQNSGIIS